MGRLRFDSEPIVITGLGLITSVGQDRETVWRSVRHGVSGVRSLENRPDLPDFLKIGAPVDLPQRVRGRLKVIELCERAAEEAIADAGIDWSCIRRERFGCAISGHMGDDSYVPLSQGREDLVDLRGTPWWQQWLPNTACSEVAHRWKLTGPITCHSTACASGLIDILSAARFLRQGQCDIALAGSGEGIHKLFAAGFRQMRVLAEHDDPQQACRPFDRSRGGFVMGEGAAMLVMERLSHALQRGARIYAEVLGWAQTAEAHHVTGLDVESEALAYAISESLRRGGVHPDEIEYINAHATGTHQNDRAETRGIRRALGQAADRACVSANKSMLGHLVNAAGSVELALTILALRDGFAPPTLNLTDQDPDCDLDCVPLVGRPGRFQHALKLSVAFGGHIAVMALRRWNDAATGFKYPISPAA